MKYINEFNTADEYQQFMDENNLENYSVLTLVNDVNKMVFQLDPREEKPISTWVRTEPLMYGDPTSIPFTDESYYFNAGNPWLIKFDRPLTEDDVVILGMTLDGIYSNLTMPYSALLDYGFISQVNEGDTQNFYCHATANVVGMGIGIACYAFTPKSLDLDDDFAITRENSIGCQWLRPGNYDPNKLIYNITQIYNFPDDYKSYSQYNSIMIGGIKSIKLIIPDFDEENNDIYIIQSITFKDGGYTAYAVGSLYEYDGGRNTIVIKESNGVYRVTDGLINSMNNNFKDQVTSPDFKNLSYSFIPVNIKKTPFIPILDNLPKDECSSLPMTMEIEFN